MVAIFEWIIMELLKRRGLFLVYQLLSIADVASAYQPEKFVKYKTTS